MKRLEVAEKTIGTNVFYIAPFPAFTSINLSGEVASLLTPLLGALAPLISTSDDLTEIDVKEIGASIGSGAINGDKLEAVMKKLLIKHKNVSVDYDGETQLLTEDIANEVFCMNAQDMYVLAFEVIRENFGGFFKNLGGQSGRLAEIMGTRTTTGNTVL